MFLASDSEVVPQSIRQAIKLASCEETQEAVQANVKATLKSVLDQTRQAQNGTSDSGEASSSSASTGGAESDASAEDCSAEPVVPNNLAGGSMLGQTLEKVFSEKGSSFFAILAASVARQTVETLMDSASDQTNSGEAFEKYKDILLSEEGKQFVSDLLVTLVVESTSIYIDKTVHVNYYDQILETAVKPQHKTFVEGLCVKLCRVVTETMMAPQPERREVPQIRARDELCSPREYPALISDEVAAAECHSNCSSPNSVVSGLKASLSTTPDSLSSRPAQSSNAAMVKEILASAAGDENVRTFLVSLASSSSAAAVGVVLEAFIPSWLMTSAGRRRRGSGAGKGGKVANAYETASEASQQALVVAFALLFLVVAAWIYRSWTWTFEDENNKNNFFFFT